MISVNRKLSSNLSLVLEAEDVEYIEIDNGVSNVLLAIDILDVGATATVKTSIVPKEVLEAVAENVYTDFQFPNISVSGSEVTSITADLDSATITAPSIIRVENTASYEAAYTQPEITAMVLTGDTRLKYNGKYFMLYSGTTKYLVWFDITGTDVKPVVEGFDTCVDYKLDISASTETVDDIAGDIVTQIGTLGTGVFTAAFVSGTDTLSITTVAEITTTDSDAGNMDEVTAVVSAFTTSQAGGTIAAVNPRIRASFRANR